MGLKINLLYEVAKIVEVGYWIWRDILDNIWEQNGSTDAISLISALNL